MDPKELRLSSRARRRTPSPIRELMPYLRVPGMISMGGGYPNPVTFPFENVELALAGQDDPVELSGEELAAAMQYGATPGYPGLLDELVRWHRHKDGVELDTAEILVLTGSQEGLYIVADLLLDEGDEVVMSEPGYPGAIAAFRSFTEAITQLPMDREGLEVDVLADMLAERKARGQTSPKFVYVIPNGHNPAGVSLSVARRRRLAKLAETYDFLILEDDPYQLVRLEPGSRPPSIQSMAPERVVRLDSFSKILCPGLRIGYASGPSWFMRAMVLHKQASSLQTGNLVQAILAKYLATAGPEGLMARIESNLELYRANLDALVESAARYLPDDVTFQVPDSGLFVWFELPPGFDGERMIDQDCAHLKVLMVPGSAFSVRGRCKNAMRASFAMVPTEDIVEGMKRFGEMIELERKRVLR